MDCLGRDSKHVFMLCPCPPPPQEESDVCHGTAEEKDLIHGPDRHSAPTGVQGVEVREDNRSPTQHCVSEDKWIDSSGQRFQ
ncbi:hypothetical protein J6590_086653 [Homalodisca vitripennis]|nr:hypothetical protein J6590_086653 [Homalodisca vitripennis]